MQSNLTSPRLLALICLALIALPSRHSDAGAPPPPGHYTATWVDTVGNWTDAASWDISLYPHNGNPGLGFTYDAVIDSLGAFVTMGTNITIEEFTLGNNALLEASGFTLTVTGLVNWQHAPSLNGGTVIAGAGVQIDSDQGQIGTLSGTLVNDGAQGLWVTTNPNSFLSGSGMFENTANGVFDVQSDSLYGFDGGGTIENSGLFKKTAGTGAFHSGWTFNNLVGGTVLGQSGDLRLANLHNTGTVRADGGIVSFTGGSNSGLLETVNASDVVRFDGGTVTLSTGTDIEGDGVVRLQSGALALSGMPGDGSGRFEFAGGTVSGTATDTLSVSRALIAGATGATNFMGGKVIANVVEITGAGSQLGSIGGTAVVRNKGDGVWNATNNFSFLTGGTGGVFHNEATGTFDVQTDSIYGFDGTGLLQNDGLLKRTTSTGNFISTWNVNNAGTIRGESGELRFNGGAFNNTGIVRAEGGIVAIGGSGGSSTGLFDTVAASDVIRFDGGSNTLATGANFTGLGVTRLDSGFLNLSGTPGNGSGRFEFAGGTVQDTGTLHVDRVLITGSTSFDAGIVQGTVEITGSNGQVGNLNGGTIINSTANGVWDNSSNFSFFNAHGGIFRNAGTFDIRTDSIYGFYHANGAPVLENFGTMKRTTSTGEFISTMRVNNSGTVQAESGTLTFNGAFHNSGSARAITGGTLKLGGGGSAGGAFTMHSYETTHAGSLIDFSGGTHSLNGAVIFLGNLRLSAGTLSVFGNNGSNGGTLETTGGTISGSGRLEISELRMTGATSFQTQVVASNGVDVTGSGDLGTLSGSGSIESKATGTWTTATGYINGDTGGFFKVGANATFDIQTDSFFGFYDLGGTPVLNNEGTLKKSGGSGAFNVGWDFDNEHIVRVQSGTLNFSGAIVQADGGTLTENWQVVSGGTGANLTGAGFGTLATNNGVVLLSGAGATFAPLQSITGSSNELVIENSAVFTTDAGLNNTGSLAVKSGADLNVTGAYVQDGGTTTLDGGRIDATTFTLNTGTLEGSGTIGSALTSDATIAPGMSAGLLTVEGGISLLDDSELTLEIGGVGIANHDRIESTTGNVALHGLLVLQLINGFIPNAANTFTVLTSANAITGAFTNVASGARLDTEGGEGSFEVNYTGNSVVLSDFEAAGTPGAPETTLLFAKTDPVPGEAPGTTFTSFGLPVLDGADVGFLATIKLAAGGSQKAIFFDGSVRLRTTDPVPNELGVDSGADFGSFKDPVFGGGKFAFIGGMKVGTGAPPVVSTDDSGVWSNASGLLRRIARENEIAPGTDGAEWKTFKSVAMPASGAGAVFLALLEAGTGATPVTSASDLGLWREVAGVAMKVLQENDQIDLDPVPLVDRRTVKTFKALGSVSASPDQRRFRSDGDLLVLVQFVEGGQAILEAPGDGTALVLLALTGDTVSEPAGATLKKLGIPAGNSSGEAFMGQLVAGPGVTSATDVAIFAEDGAGGFEAVVSEGDFAPDETGAATAAKFLKFKDPLFAGTGEHLFFFGTLKQGVGPVGPGNDTGLWTDAGGTLHEIAREGSVAPGAGTDVFSKFISLEVAPEPSPLRNVSFTAKLLLSGSVTASNALGLWARDRDDNVWLLSRQGFPMPPTAGTGPAVTALHALKAAGGSPGQGRGTSNTGALVFRVTRGVAGQAIYHVQMP